MQITAFDYIRDRKTSGASLARLGTVITEARKEAETAGSACFLFDNGDTFQGTPVADYIAACASEELHPMAAALTHLQFDAIGLGNHDFDHGLEQLSLNLAGLDVPVVCSNLSTPHLPQVQASLQLEHVVVTSHGDTETLRLGILATLPDKTALWSRGRLENRARFVDPVEALKEGSARLRAEGADLVIALAHMGLALFEQGADAQNRVQDVAALNDIDVVIGGHTHLRFPGDDHRGLAHADWQSGTVHGKPVVQPGPNATDLGIIDLELEKRGDGSAWQIQSSTVTLRPVQPDVPETPDIAAIAAPMHNRTRDHLDESVARIARPMHSYFALATPSPLPALLAEAKRQVIQRALVGSEYANLPLLAAASTALTGGIDGPDNFLFVESGNIKRRHVAGMNPYANSVWAVKTSGEQVIDWLERAALIFNHLKADAPDQALIDARIPGFRYDAIYGLEYEIDPSRPARFDIAGRIVEGERGRIIHATWRGAPVDPEQSFIVATTDHRASGGGFYMPFEGEDVVVRGQTLLQDAVLSYLESPDCMAVRGAKPWRFVSAMGRQAVLMTAPEATAYLDDIAHLQPEVCGETPDGFLRIRLSL